MKAFKSSPWIYGLFACVMALTSLTALASSPASAVASNQFAWPVNGSVPAGDIAWHRNAENGARAVDVAASVGSSVHAAQSGTVETVHTGCANSNSSGCGHGFGNYVVIRHNRAGVSNPLYTLYGHLDNSQMTVSTGSVVATGIKLGEIAMSGSTTGAHVHFAIGTCSTPWSAGSWDYDTNCTVWNGGETTAMSVSTSMAVPGTYHRLVATNTPEIGLDANPSLALSGDATIFVQHTARDGRASSRIKTLNGSGFDTVQTGSSTAWSLGGTSDIAADPTQEGRAWVAAIKDAGEHGELYLFRVESGNSTNIAHLDVGSETDQWSLNAAPSIAVDSQGNVYVAAVQADGDMSVFKRNATTGNIARTSIGNAGAWSTTGTVSLAMGPDDAIWLAAVTKQSVSEVRTYRGNPGMLSFSSYGKVGVDNWTVEAAPAIAVDNNGNVTVIAVKVTGAMWSYYNVGGQNGNWVKVNDDVGASQTWSTEGTMNMAVNGQGRVYVVGIRGTTANGGELQVFRMDPDSTVANSSWIHDHQVGTDSDWSPYAAPDIASTSVGTVFIAAVKQNCTLHTFVRNHSSGTWSNYGQIGSNGWTGCMP